MLLSIYTCFANAESNIAIPRGSLNDQITVTADTAYRWRQGSYDVWLLRGHCDISQGRTQARSRDAVLWIRHGQVQVDQPTKVIAYLEGDVSIEDQSGPQSGRSPVVSTSRVTDNHWFGRFHTRAPLQIEFPDPLPEPQNKPEVFRHGMERFDPDWGRSIRRTAFSQMAEGPAPVDSLPPGTRRIQAFSRSEVPVQARWFPSPTGNEWIAVVVSGVNLLVEGLDGFVEGIGTVDKIDVETDRLVIWTAGMQPDLRGQTLQSEDTPLEIYMEGNIVFRQGDRIIYAHQMYYDVRRNVGIILDAELLTPVPEYQGLARLKARILRQLDENRFVAHDALLTTSRLGEPGYYFQSETIHYQDLELPMIDPVTGVPLVNSFGESVVDHQRLATSQNNFLYLGGVPILYWPTMATDLEKPSYYIDGVAIRNDSIFGTQLLLDLDAYQLLGIRDPPQGTEWDISLDYLSDRGLGYGTSFEYDRPDFFGHPTPSTGFFDAWFIKDHGVDNLGRGRRSVSPEEDFRGRTFWNHRQHLANNFTISAQLGWISDRNFLEQYYEREWDEWKDETTGIELKQIFDNQSWSITTDARVNDFFTQTEWLPRLDHFWLGHPLLGDRLTWFEHSNVSYARLRPATAPSDPTQAMSFEPLPWQPDVQGERLATRQEIDLPFELGPIKVVPYALGELAHWGEDIDGDDLQRAYFQTGARASIPFWAVNPNVEDQLFNVHGLAHKVVFDAELSYADANRNLTDLALYDPINDDSVEAFERRFFSTTFGLSPGNPFPPKFDPRFYAVRTGLQGWVTSPSTEIAEDLTVLRMGMRHRWQTKRGRLGSRRIIDWITFDSNAVWFPKKDRDNFGEDFGLINYDFRWHPGDRVTLVSDGGFDFFGDGLRTASVGGFLTRPPRGSAYLGLRTFAGPFSSNVVNASYSYWMSPKWVSTLGSSIDLGNTGNIGQQFSLTRIGESLLVTLGFNVDRSKDNVGVSLLVEPRFLPKSRVNNLPGIQIPPTGAFGLD